MFCYHSPMQKISPFLWFNNEGEEAAKFYTSIFKNSRIGDMSYSPEGTPGPEGSVMVVQFFLNGFEMNALNGGPVFAKNPSISFFVQCDTAEEVNGLWAKLIGGGKALMEIDSYPWSKRYGWLQDKYGVCWQLMLGGDGGQKIIPSLMYVQDQFGKAEEAINLYVSTFPDSKINHIERYVKGEGDGVEGKIKYSSFTLCGQDFTAMESNLKHMFTFSEGVSLHVSCDTQEEIDAYTKALSADPTAEICGWVKDKFGVSWQIDAAVMTKMILDKDKAKVARVMQAMMKMKKLDIATLQKAFEGK